MDGNRVPQIDADFDAQLRKVATRFKAVRTDNKLTQSKLGDMLSVSQDTVSLWETGKSIPTAEYIIAICKLFGVSADYLLGLSDY
ncbi:MAG: helix-turn-helix domain-containing protein [Roseburia sp.]|nr:helix-turn-helix domain-containing protein [Roseburia sp.]